MPIGFGTDNGIHRRKINAAHVFPIWTERSSFDQGTRYKKVNRIVQNK